jgi:putative Mg2+ transporter-C (MgtC) family protein
MSLWAAAWRLGLAFALGGLVGWEREHEEKPAGLRTLILVTTGSTLFVLVSQAVTDAVGGQIDATRVIAGIAQGVGFLGAGTIFMARGAVHGLTTAAAIWAMSAVGAACGFGLWAIALVGTVLTFVALRLLGPLAVRIGHRAEQDKPSA